MNLIKKNEMDPELVRQLMEHSGYEVVKEAVEDVAPESEIMEEAEEVSIQNYLFEVNETFFSLTETVEEIEGELYLQLSEMAEDDVMNLDESTTAILESVIFDDVEYLLGESFVDEESGEVFVHLSIQEENDSE
jgi:hypothetical protein|tara:strand:- start:3633 stop:4034 length:402 start_codon:yes stop_codon:yes gene_type:complete